jgi:hypothetical protein
LSKFKYHGQRFEVIFNKLPLNLANADEIIITPNFTPIYDEKRFNNGFSSSSYKYCNPIEKSFKFDDQMIIHASIVNFPIGSGSKNLMSYMIKKKSVIKI